MRVAASLVLSVVFGLIVGCGDSSGPAASTSASASGKPAASGTASAAAGGTAAAVSLEGVVPMAKLVAAVKADEKAVRGKKVTVEGTYWGMWKETSEGKTTYVLSIVASKDDTGTKGTCELTAEPKDLPSADNQAHAQAIAITAEGTLQASSSGRPILKDCSYKKK